MAVIVDRSVGLGDWPTMARDILANPGVYVAVVVSDLSDEDPTEWAVLRKEPA